MSLRVPGILNTRCSFPGFNIFSAHAAAMRFFLYSQIHPTFALDGITVPNRFSGSCVGRPDRHSVGKHFTLPSVQTDSRKYCREHLPRNSCALFYLFDRSRCADGVANDYSRSVYGRWGTRHDHFISAGDPEIFIGDRSWNGVPGKLPEKSGQWQAYLSR